MTTEDNKVYVGNLPFEYDEEDLNSKFTSKDCTSIEVYLVRFRGYSKGYGFITYESKEQAEKAIEQFNGVEHEGRKVFLKFARTEEETKKYKDHASRGKALGKRGEAKVNDKPAADFEQKSKTSSLLEPRKHDDFEDSNVKEEGKFDYEANSKPQRNSRPRGRGRGRFRQRRYDRPDTVSENTVYVAGIPFHVTESQQLLDAIPENYKELVSHAKIAKMAIFKEKVTETAVIDEEVKVKGKGFGFLQFKNAEDCKKFLEEYGRKGNDGPELLVQGRKVRIYESIKDLTKTDD